MPTPNLFHYATSELSQDAVLAYLLAWADQTYKGDPRHALGLDLAEVLAKAAADQRASDQHYPLGLHPLDPLPNFSRVTIRRQLDRIDVVVFFDAKFEDVDRPLVVTKAVAAILIEDKVFSSQHSAQLKRYLSEFDHGVPPENLYPIFYKTGLQHYYGAEREAGFALFGRMEMQVLLKRNREAVDQDAILDQYLRLLDEWTDRYAAGHDAVPSGDSYAWQGFLNEIATKLRKTYSDTGWSYVSNKSGGFYGCWWDFQPVPLLPATAVAAVSGQPALYLQLEQDCLLLKLDLSGLSGEAEHLEQLRTQMRWSAIHLIEAATEKSQLGGFLFKRSGRVGRWTSIFELQATGQNQPFLQPGEPIDAVLSRLKAATVAIEQHIRPLFQS